MIVVGVVNRIYRYAARRLGWVGTNPVSLMLSSERPKPSQGKRRRIFEGGELEQTIAAADEPYRTLFTVAALTGARLSELLGLTWDRVRLDPLDDAEIEFALQVDRTGGSARPRPTDPHGPCRSRRSSPESSVDHKHAVDVRRADGLRVRDAYRAAVRAAQHRADAATRTGQGDDAERRADVPALHARDEHGEPSRDPARRGPFDA